MGCSKIKDAFNPNHNSGLDRECEKVKEQKSVMPLRVAVDMARRISSLLLLETENFKALKNSVFSKRRVSKNMHRINFNKPKRYRPCSLKMCFIVKKHMEKQNIEAKESSFTYIDDAMKKAYFDIRYQFWRVIKK